MTRTERLLQLLELLRQHRHAVNGLRLAEQMGLNAPAEQSLAKLAAVLPSKHQRHFDTSIHLLPPQNIHAAEGAILRDIRHALRSERKLAITYVDLKGKSSTRTLWPTALAYFEQALVLVAWCESRSDFRHFRTDRIKTLSMLDLPYARRRSALLAAWRASLQTQASASTTDKN